MRATTLYLLFVVTILALYAHQVLLPLLEKATAVAGG